MFPAIMFPALALAAVIVEAVAGYPDGLFRRVGHPVTWIGGLIGALDRRWNLPGVSDFGRRIRGVLALGVLLAVALIGGLAIQAALQTVLGLAVALIPLAVLASSLVAQRSLDDHVAAVADALERHGMPRARAAVSRIVGRDTAALDESGVSRAAIESLAENFSDGVVAPVFWMAVLGLPGGLAYKAVNTADSMIGHRTERHGAFGWASARFDDLINLPASRLSALWLVIAACLLPGARPVEAVGAVLRDAARHKSPNAGWPEAAMAGALGIRLAGPRTYGGVEVATAWMGHGRDALNARDIRRALTLYRVACAAQAVALAAVAIGLAMTGFVMA